MKSGTFIIGLLLKRWLCYSGLLISTLCKCWSPYLFISFPFFMDICGMHMCVHVCMCVGTHVGVHLHMRVCTWKPEVDNGNRLPSVFHLMHWSRVSSSKPEAASSFWGWNDRHSRVSMHLNSAPHACKASTLSLEPQPQPWISMFVQTMKYTPWSQEYKLVRFKSFCPQAKPSQSSGSHWY